MAPRAQSLAEYAVLVSVIAVAVVGMGLYLKRSVNAGLKVTEEQVNQVDWKMGQIQRAPGNSPPPSPPQSCEEQCRDSFNYYLCMQGCQASNPPETTP